MGLPVEVSPTVSSDQWRDDIRNFHVGLVSLSPGGASACLPSKTYAMMAGGLAVIGICPCWSDLARLINSIDAGWVVNNSAFSSEPDLSSPEYFNQLREHRSYDQIVYDFFEIVNSIVTEYELLKSKRKNAFDGIRSHYNLDNTSRKWDSLINSVCKSR